MDGWMDASEIIFNSGFRTECGGIPDIGADELRASQNGPRLRVGSETHRFVVDGDEVIAHAEASVAVDGAAARHRRDHHSVDAGVHHFDADAQRIAAFLNADGLLERRGQRWDFGRGRMHQIRSG